MSIYKESSGTKEALYLIGGMFIGAAIWWGATSFFYREAVPQIEPLFTDESSVMFAEIRNFLVNLEDNANISWCSADKGNLEYMHKHLSEAEIYFAANKHLRSLPEAEKKFFYDSYQSWAADYRKKCSFAERMQNHDDFPLSTEHIEVRVSHKFKDEMLQKYLLFFRDPVKTWDAHSFQQESSIQKIIDLKSGKVVGKVYNHESAFLRRVEIFYPYEIPESRRQKVAVFLREINPDFQIDKKGRCICSSNSKINPDNGFFKLYPELQRLMDKNCRVEECLESVRKYPLSKRRNIEIIDMKPFEVK